MKRLIPLLAAGIVLVLSGTGCIVDSRYDLSKLNTEMTVFKGAEFPVPSVSLTLGDLLQLDGYQFIKVAQNGDYLVQFDLDPLDVQVEIPDSHGEVHIPLAYQPVPYSFGNVPDFISGKDQQFEADLSDMTVTLEVESAIPASFTATGTVQTLVKDAVKGTFHFDNVGVNPGKQTYYLKEQAKYSGEISVPGLGNMLIPFPDAVQLNNLDLYANAQEVSGIVGNTYGLSFRTHVETPICFSENHRMTMSVPLDAELDLEEIGLKRAILNVIYDNDIPLNFTLSAYALDAEGKKIDGVKAETSDPIWGGTSGGLVVELTTQGDLRFDQIVLELTISSDSRIAGMHINQNQVLRLRDMSLYLPDGIQIRLDTEN
ncbi:MAG: hypothetical protein IKW89_01005 [Bacteroidales bacterium]|nr:hypothetical protein [Bacteroidales bacterium]